MTVGYNQHCQARKYVFEVLQLRRAENRLRVSAGILPDDIVSDKFLKILGVLFFKTQILLEEIFTTPYIPYP